MVLRRGSKGKAVGRLQAKLRQLGHYAGPLDNDFGPLMEAAVLAFQKSTHEPPDDLTPLEVDGIAGSGTLAWLGLAGAVKTRPVESGLAPDALLEVSKYSGWRKSMARIYNNYGAYLERAAADLGIDAADAAGVLKVESGGSGFVDGRLKIRLENHVFRREWITKPLKAKRIDKAEANRRTKVFDKHYKVGKSWKGHEFSADGKTWGKVHIGSQDREWEAFEFARDLDENAASLSISMGAGQVMGFNYRAQGFDTPMAMVEAMSTGIEAQLDGIFTFIRKTRRCIAGLRAVPVDYVGFARGYNGSSRAKVYGEKIEGYASAYRAIVPG